MVAAFALLPKSHQWDLLLVMPSERGELEVRELLFAFSVGARLQAVNRRVLEKKPCYTICRRREETQVYVRPMRRKRLIWELEIGGQASGTTGPF